jgi:hypothetical protein|tara:strand:+ start:91 stop:399 length:309 start_codon:yes stop_codon:yes gene_type:complete
MKDYSGSAGLWKIQDELLNAENPDLEELERITEMIRNPPLAAKMDGALWHLLQITEHRDVPRRRATSSLRDAQWIEETGGCLSIEDVKLLRKIKNSGVIGGA